MYTERYVVYRYGKGEEKIEEPYSRHVYSKYVVKFTQPYTRYLYAKQVITFTEPQECPLSDKYCPSTTNCRCSVKL